MRRGTREERIAVPLPRARETESERRSSEEESDCSFPVSLPRHSIQTLTPAPDFSRPPLSLESLICAKELLLPLSFPLAHSRWQGESTETQFQDSTHNQLKHTVREMRISLAPSLLASALAQSGRLKQQGEREDSACAPLLLPFCSHSVLFTHRLLVPSIERRERERETRGDEEMPEHTV